MKYSPRSLDTTLTGDHLKGKSIPAGTCGLTHKAHAHCFITFSQATRDILRLIPQETPDSMTINVSKSLSLRDIPAKSVSLLNVWYSGHFALLYLIVSC